MVRRATWAALVVALFAGCSSDGSEVEVTGKVTLDGQPVGSGNQSVIRFEPTDGKGKAAEGFVDKGEYKVRIQPGMYKVSITWNRPSGKPARPGAKGPGSDAQEIVAEIPAKYNTSTTQTAEVSSSKKQHDFDLKK